MDKELIRMLPAFPILNLCRSRLGRAAGLAGLLLAAACSRQPGPAPTGPAPTQPAATAAITTEVAATQPGAADFEWSVEFVQNGAVVPAANDQVPLARAPFTIRARMTAPLPVKLNVYTTDQNFQAIQPGFTLTDDCALALCTGMDLAEERLNPAQDLFVDVELTHYLYYQGPDDHRWSRAEITDTGAVFERDVARLNNVPIEQSTDPALYMLFFANATNPSQIDPGELKKITVLFQ